MIQKPGIFSSTVPLIAISMVAALGFSRCGSDNNVQTLGETCMSLAAGIAQSPASEVGEADYEKYADLEVPPLPPEQALERFHLEEGFRIEVVAHEPMVIDPIAMDTDADGRLWVINMPSYNRMPVGEILDTTGERTEAREAAMRERARQKVEGVHVVVLEDTTGDGKMDTRRIFFEDLQRPLAIKVLHDGVLVGEPPNLWFIRDTNGDGKGDKKELVSGSYGTPDIPSTQGGTNGLIWGMDNWLYSTYFPGVRRVNGRWQTRPFEQLGQWGMTQDNWGRLYSTHNSWPLLTHQVPYGYSERHPIFDVNEGINVRIAPNQPLWPAHPTGVNRGYRDGMLREDGTLSQATGIASTMIYRGSQFGEDYVGNAFTPEPAGNLIKRLIFEGDPSGIETRARFAYEGREFLTSTDERFRPVNLYNARDGSIYVVDMYRGFYEYLLYTTDYLEDYILDHELDIPTGKFGRIYRITREDREHDENVPKFSALTPEEVAGYLENRNGLLRDQAQQVLVQCSPEGVAPGLEVMVQDNSIEAWSRLQALWTLEGLSRSTYGQEQLTRTALQALEDKHARVRAAAVRILEPAIKANSTEVLGRLEQLASEEKAPYVQLQLLASLGESGSDKALELIAAILHDHAGSPYFREMALTGVFQREEQFANILRSEYGWRDDDGEAYEALLTKLDEAVRKRSEKGISHLTEAQQELYEHGEIHYATTCKTCHGAEGGGIGGIGAALAGSKWVEGDPEKVVRIVLQGFDGGVAERGENIPNEMPGHAFLSDEDLAGILTYIRQSWGNEASPIAPEEVARIRAKTRGRQDAWTPAELRKLPD